MSDNLPAPITRSKFSLWLPYVSLALTAAAFGLGAPARLARLNLRPAALLAGLEFDASIRYEPFVSPDQPGVKFVAARRALDGLMSRQLIAFK
jgi:hypothetical protein